MVTYTKIPPKSDLKRTLSTSGPDSGLFTVRFGTQPGRMPDAATRTVDRKFCNPETPCFVR